MKKIIDGKRYDTSLARFIERFEVAPGRFESLYRKRTGEYFLYSEMDQKGHLLPLAYDEARRWAKSHMVVEAFDAEFGVIIDDTNRIPLLLSLNAAGVERARRVAAQRGVLLSALVDELFDSL